MYRQETIENENIIKATLKTDPTLKQKMQVLEESRSMVSLTTDRLNAAIAQLSDLLQQEITPSENDNEVVIDAKKILTEAKSVLLT